MPDAAAIEAHGLRKYFGDVKALDGVDLSAPKGTVLGLLGPNGAGKTTAVRILTTLLAPDGGTARVAGYDVVRDAEALRSAIGLAGQYAAVDENLTGRENLTLVGRLYHLPKAEVASKADELLERFDLAAAADRPASTYSGGMRRRLDLGASLVGNPQVLFLDEPTTGLDPRSRIGLWEVIEQLVSDGTTLLLTTQYLEEADRLTDSISVIDNGKVIAEGTSDELKSRVGGEVLEVTVRPGSHAVAGAAALAPLACGDVQVDVESGTAKVPLKGGAGDLAEAVRLLDGAGITIAEIDIRRPTLDDVFLALTGHAAAEARAEAEGHDGDGARRRSQARSRS